MTEERGREGFELPRLSLFIVLLPMAVFVMINVLVLLYAKPVNVLPPALVFDASLEAAGRLRLLAGLLLYAGVAVFALAMTVPAAWRLERHSLWWVVTVYVAMLVAFVSLKERAHPPELQTLAGQALVCQALSLPSPQPLLKPPPRVQQAGSPLRIRQAQPTMVDVLNDPSRCDAPNFSTLRRLYLVQRILMLFSGPAIVLAAISCIAMPRDSIRRRQVCREQAARLNSILYVAAALMVTGLIFVGAFFQWPGFALRKDAAAAYQGLVSGIIFYYGVGFSIFIASFYLPVAAWVGATWRSCCAPKPPCRAVGDEADSESQEIQASPAEGKGGVDEELGLITAVQLVKIGAAIFAPAIAGLVGTVVKLPT